MTQDKLNSFSAKEIQKLVYELEIHQIELEMQNEELVLAHTQLNESKKKYFDLYDLAPLAYCTLNEDGLIKETNLKASSLLGFNRSTLVNKAFATFIKKDDQDIYYLFHKKLLETKKQEECELRLIHKDYTTSWVHISAVVQITAENKQEVKILINDINKRKESEEKLKISASVFNNTSEAIMITNPDGTIYDVNEAFVTITGYSSEEAIGNKPSILSSGHYEKDFYHMMWRTLIKVGKWSGEVWNLRKNGELYAENLVINAIYDDQGDLQHYVALFSDITLSKNYLKDLENLANYDKLTSLPNRRLLADRLQQNMIQVHRRNKSLAVVFLDLDGFKEVNDTYGHEMGDNLLVLLATQMHSALREEDTFARIGGDEFVAILSNLSDVNTSLPLINRLLDVASKRVTINGHSMQVSASLGITFYPQSERIQADQLLRQADQAMYEAKILGKNRYHIFNIKQNILARERYESIERLNKALNENEFILYYQPKVNMKTGKVIGVEALIRWDHRLKGIIYPDEFLPIINEHILSISIGEWVIKTALKQIEEWQSIGLSIPISVNISAQQLLENNFVERLELILLEYPKVKPSFLELEILESTKLKDLEQASKVINSCKKLGLHFALDDFGTGYSSLTYFKKLPIIDIKIDKSFIRDMLKDSNELAILEAIIKLSHVFKRSVIAEGVETLEQGRVLLQLGCELAQGNIISAPMPAREFQNWLKNWKTHISWTNQKLMNENELKILFASIGS